MQAETNKTPATAAAVVTHEVANYEAWKAVFDSHAPARKRAGIVGTHVNRSLENANLLTVYVAASSASALHSFLADPEMKVVMSQAGVVGAPAIAMVTPVEDLTVKDRPLPGAIVRHRVASFDAWKAAFDAHGAARAKAGIVGHAVNRGTDDANVVVAYLQADNVETLRAFSASPDLKSAMAAAGVQGPPQIAFVQGGIWAEN